MFPHRAGLILAIFGACSAGDNLAPGHSHSTDTLVRVDDEPPGANCENGGAAIHTGADLDGSGYVEDAEIASTSYVCSGDTGLRCLGETTLEGVITIFETADFAQLAGITCIDGDLIIAGVSDEAIPDLDLESVTGGITIAGNTELTSLDGLQRLRAIGGVYAVQGNDTLGDIDALGNLEEAASVLIVGNDSLVDLTGLETWVDIQHQISISNNASLQSLHGLENLLTTSKVLNVTANRSLTTVDALDRLRSVAVLEISGNASLSTVSLDALQKANVRVLINSNAALTSVSLPSFVTTVGLQFQNNAALRSIDLPSLVVTNSFLVQLDAALTSIAAPSLVSATGQVDFYMLPSLTDVDLTALGTTGSAFALYGLTSLADLSGFSQLSAIAGDLTVRSCSALTSFSGLERLETVAGNMLVRDNVQLADFTGMVGSFAAVDGNLTIVANPQLPVATSQAFASGITVGGTITIQ